MHEKPSLIAIMYVTISWVEVVRIIPEFRILRLTFQSQPQNTDLADCNTFYDLFSVNLKIIKALNM